jgi:two-component system, NtrC family, sensor histidine kinase HydH
MENKDACPPDCRCRPNRTRLLKSRSFFLSVWLLMGIITVLHYTVPMEHHWAHDVLRRAYYLPIVIAAMRSGLIGGLITTTIVVAAYLPHAFFYHELIDPADGLEKSLEMVLYFVVATVAGYLSDLECRRRMQLTRAVEEQKSLTTQLARAGRLAALGEVVAGIAHEIKNPLHALAGTAEIVDSEIAEESEVRPMWNIHKSEIERLKRTADTFLSFARPQPIASELLDLRAVASRLSDLVAAETRQKGITLELLSEDGPVTVTGDVDQLAQVALNVAVNAIKAIGDAGGMIRVSVGTETIHHREMAFMRIENNGPPIPEAAREHLFDPFHSSTDGAGLGLSISDRIVQQHHGFFEVLDGDLGVAFTIYLPLS